MNPIFDFIRMSNLFDPLESAGKKQLTIFIGYDPREDICAKILAHTIRSHSSVISYNIIPLVYSQLFAYGYTNRELDKRGSTEFTMTRFLAAPIVNMAPFTGASLALFLDCDMMFTRSVDDLILGADLSKPVSVCKHDYVPAEALKMQISDYGSYNGVNGSRQEVYPKKNWSSVTLWNCNHEEVSNRTLDWANDNTPSHLHRFESFNEEDIGSLDRKWNYLVGEGMDREEYYGLKKDELPYNIHHTLGSPVFRLYQDSEYSGLWKENFKDLMKRPFDELRDTLRNK